MIVACGADEGSKLAVIAEKLINEPVPKHKRNTYMEQCRQRKQPNLNEGVQRDETYTAALLGASTSTTHLNNMDRGELQRRCQAAGISVRGKGFRWLEPYELVQRLVQHANGHHDATVEEKAQSVRHPGFPTR
jgi:hypothetical protein